MTDVAYAEWLAHVCPSATDDVVLAPPTSLSEVADQLAAHGCATRLVAATDLAARPQPLVLSCDGGRIAALTRTTSGYGELWFTDGACASVTRAELRRRSDGVCLEIVAPLSRQWRGLAGRVVHEVLSHPRELLQLLALVAVIAAMSTVVPFAVGVIVDDAVPMRLNGLIELMAVAVVLVSVQRGVLGLGRELAASHLLARHEHVVATAVLRETLALGFPVLRRHVPAHLLELHRHAAAGTRLLIESAVALVLALTTTIAQSVVLLVVAPSFAWLLVLAVFVAAASVALYARRLARLGRGIVAAVSQEQTLLADALRDVETLACSGAQRWAVSRWLRAAVADRLARYASERTRIARDSLLDTGRLGLGVLALVAGASAVHSGALSIGALLAITVVIGGLSFALADAARHATILFTLPQYFGPVDALPRADTRRSRRVGVVPGDVAIRVCDASFRYDEGPWILRGVCCEIRHGTHVRIDGSSGSGKSTLLRLIAGMLPPSAGTVEVLGGAPDGALVCYVPQDAPLLDGSIDDNLEVMSGGADPSRLAAAARETGLADWLATLPMRGATQVGQAGASLSGGQRQLVLVTAALASTRPIVVLDESSSQLDPIARRRIAALAGFSGRTLVTVDHVEAGRPAGPGETVLRIDG